MKTKHLKKLVIKNGNELIDQVLTSEKMRILVGGSADSCGCYNCTNLTCNQQPPKCPPVYA